MGCGWLLKISLLALILVFSRVAVSALTDGVGVVWNPHPYGWGSTGGLFRVAITALGDGVGRLASLGIPILTDGVRRCGLF